MSPSESLVAGKHSRRRSLDGIRAIAILGVFLFHSVVPWATGGWLGVAAFFVLSGYLITTLLLNEHRKTGAVSLRRFWARRMLRLWPALVVMVILEGTVHQFGTFPMSLGAYFHAGWEVVLYFADLKIAYFGGGNWGAIGHTWTLGVEMYFYLLWPLLLVYLLKRRRALIVPSLVVLCLLSVGSTLLFFAINPAGWELYYAPHTQVLPVLLGCLLAAVRHEDLLPRMGTRVGGVLAIVGLGGLLALLHFAPTDSASPHGFYWPLVGASVATWLLLLGLELNPDSMVGKLLSWEPLAMLGLISYGFYLYQSPVVYGVGGFMPIPLYPHVVVLFLMSIGCATISWLFVEQKFLQIKDRLGSRVEATTVTTGGVRLRPHSRAGTESSAETVTHRGRN